MALADVLHAIVDKINWRSEEDKLGHHAALDEHFTPSEDSAGETTEPGAHERDTSRESDNHPLFSKADNDPPLSFDSKSSGAPLRSTESSPTRAADESTGRRP